MTLLPLGDGRAGEKDITCEDRTDTEIGRSGRSAHARRERTKSWFTCFSVTLSL